MLKEENTGLKNDLKKKCKSIDNVKSELLKTKSEYERANKLLSNTKSELANLNVAKINEMQTCFKCDKCELALESFALLTLFPTAL